MTTADEQNVSLDAAADAASESLNTTDAAPAKGSATQPAKAGSAGPAAATKPAEGPQPWKSPGWSQRWKEPSRKALEALATLPGAREHLDAMVPQLDDTYGYMTRREQEFSRYHQQVNPLFELLAPYESVYARNGMTLQQGVQQLLSVAEHLAQDPDQAFPFLAGMYRPQDAAKAIVALAQQWGVDPRTAFADAPFEDDATRGMKQQFGEMFRTLNERFESLSRNLHQHQQGVTRQQQTAIVDQLKALSAAANDDGSPKYPHLERVMGSMIRALRGGFVQEGPIEKRFVDAYAFAVHNDPELQQEIVAQREEAARIAAAQRANARTQGTEQALNASRNVAGKGSNATGNKKPMSLDEAADSGFAEVANA